MGAKLSPQKESKEWMVSFKFTNEKEFQKLRKQTKHYVNKKHKIKLKLHSGIAYALERMLIYS